MALVSTDIGLFPPPYLGTVATGSTFTFDTSTDVLAIIFQVPFTGTLSNVHYRIATVASPVMTHRIEIRTVDATTGKPSAANTLYGSSTTITVDASTYAAATNYTAAVNATGATAGDLAAIVFDLSAFTSGNFTQQESKLSVWAAQLARASAFPYQMTNTAASDVLAADFMSCLALEYSGTVFYPIYPGIGFVGTTTSTTSTSNGATRRAGNAFTPLTPRRARGIYAIADIDGATTLTLRLASDDSILATATPDKDVRGSASNAPQWFMFDSGATYTLAAGTGYYVTMNGTDATGGVLYGFNNGVSQAMLGASPGGTNCFGVTHNGTAYTNLTTANAVTRYHIGLITDQEDNGVGAGGSGGGMVMTRLQLGM